MNEFDALGLSENLLKAIKELGFENPTPIQQKSIPLLLSTDTDLVGLAQTGTGKTAAFGLPMCHKTDFSRNAVQGQPENSVCKLPQILPSFLPTHPEPAWFPFMVEQVLKTKPVKSREAHTSLWPHRVGW
jgi:hypothetical protein